MDDISISFENATEPIQLRHSIDVWAGEYESLLCSKRNPKRGLDRLQSSMRQWCHRCQHPLQSPSSYEATSASQQLHSIQSKMLQWIDTKRRLKNESRQISLTYSKWFARLAQSEDGTASSLSALEYTSIDTRASKDAVVLPKTPERIIRATHNFVQSQTSASVHSGLSALKLGSGIVATVREELEGFDQQGLSPEHMQSTQPTSNTDGPKTPPISFLSTRSPSSKGTVYIPQTPESSRVFDSIQPTPDTPESLVRPTPFRLPADANSPSLRGQKASHHGPKEHTRKPFSCRWPTEFNVFDPNNYMSNTVRRSSSIKAQSTSKIFVTLESLSLNARASLPPRIIKQEKSSIQAEISSKTVLASVEQHIILNGLEIYDLVVRKSTESSMRHLFKDGATQCYWNTTRKKRCCNKLCKGKLTAIRDTIDALEGSDPTTDFSECMRLVVRLSLLTICKRVHNRDGKATKDIVTRFEENARTGGVHANLDFERAWKTYLNGEEYYKYTRFEPYQPSEYRNQGTKASLEDLIQTPVKGDELKKGHLYAYGINGKFGYIKIGWTTKSIAQRMQGWKDKCEHAPQVLLGSSELIPYAKRVEKLVHTELKDLRYRQIGCSCSCTHKEWFSVGVATVQECIERWSDWIKTSPYTEEGAEDDEKVLKDHIRRLNVLFERRNSVTGGHVELMEMSFTFVGRQPTWKPVDPVPLSAEESRDASNEISSGHDLGRRKAKPPVFKLRQRNRAAKTEINEGFDSDPATQSRKRIRAEP